MLLLALAAVVIGAARFAWSAKVAQTRRCRRCGGDRYIPHHGRFYIVCPGCGATGRQVKSAARIAAAAQARTVQKGT